MRNEYRKRVFAHAIANSVSKQDLDTLLKECVPAEEETPPFKGDKLPTVRWWAEASEDERHAATLGATMKRYGIQTVKMSISGGGDSGQLDHFEAEPGCTGTPITPFGGTIVGIGTIDELIERVACSLMDAVCPGWYNNDGGEGLFVAEWGEGTISGTVSLFSESIEESEERQGKLPDGDPLLLALIAAGREFDLATVCLGAELEDDHTWINSVTRSSGKELNPWTEDFPKGLHDVEAIHSGVATLLADFEEDSARITFDLATGRFSLVLQNIIQETGEHPASRDLRPWVAA
jgi:hypothetical protein